MIRRGLERRTGPETALEEYCTYKKGGRVIASCFTGVTTCIAQPSGVQQKHYKNRKHSTRRLQLVSSHFNYRASKEFVNSLSKRQRWDRKSISHALPISVPIIDFDPNAHIQSSRYASLGIHTVSGRMICSCALLSGM